MGRGRLGLVLSWAGSLLLGACFRDSGVVSSRCTVGESTCSCRDGDDPCDAGLVCDAGNICRSARCQDGREGCACVDGNLCLGDLQCIDQSCLPPDGDDSGPPTTTGTTDTTTSTGVTTAMPVTTVDPDTSDVDVGPGTTTLPPDTDSGMMTSGPGPTDGGSTCGCGWAGPFYDCGSNLPPEDPDEISPRQCPDQMIGLGEPCGSITVTGCCMGDVIVYCLGDMDGLWVDDCGAMDDQTCGPSGPPV